ncbi:helix-turn-helix transcriptional regulator [Sphingosinicella rhizophila]|uniref:AraC family transcriptional regulator n=1 Tax=Sphingosinicella rhizophila TaxID=3050082 RepID=A0ABU3QB43_9SPHN|nr:AraC family transcriptional regulator [Sphingosinicella sp. GR2756]MDT9600599.1 AraC family transcriptional regulator [Sphingosinicella sp. GR2756]
MTTCSHPQSQSLSRPVPGRRYPAPAKDAATLVMPYTLEDQVIHQSDERRDLVEAFMPLSDNRHYRLQSIGHYGAGQYEFCGLSDGFFIVFGDVNLAAPLSLYMSYSDSLQVHVASNGDSEYVFPEGDILSLEAANTSIFITPAGEAAVEATFAGCNRYIGLSIHREALKTLYAGGEHELPDILQLFLEGGLQRTLARSLPLRAALLRCLEDVHACPLEGLRRRLFLQSKAVEILCQAIEALEHAEGFGSAEATMLTARGVMKAQRLLAENFAAPPSLENLAHEVGLSRSGLCAGFRQILGQSVFDYTQDLRMQQALAMLSERDASISQIAYAVGYNRASSFSVAVQRHFGATPTELRRRCTSPVN